MFKACSTPYSTAALPLHFHPKALHKHKETSIMLHSFVHLKHEHTVMNPPNLLTKTFKREFWPKTYPEYIIESLGYGRPPIRSIVLNTLLAPFNSKSSLVTVPRGQQAVIFYDYSGKIKLPCYHVKVPATYEFNPIGRTVKLIPMKPQKTDIQELTVDIWFQKELTFKGCIEWRVLDAQACARISDIASHIKEHLKYALEALSCEIEDSDDMSSPFILSPSIKDWLNEALNAWKIEIHDVVVSDVKIIDKIKT